METNIVKKRAATTKQVAKKSTTVDPFAEVVEVSAPAKRAAKKVEAPVITVSTDAFAAPAGESSPVKKRPVKKAASKAVAVAAPTKRAAKKPVKKAVKAIKAGFDVADEIAATEPVVEVSPVFKALADVSLPEL